MNSLSISVVLSVRNGERYLAQALDSIAAQTLQPEEILVIDGASTDATAAVAASYPGVKVLPQLSTGVPPANNQGIRAARGDLVAFLEHDDLWLPEKLERQAREFHRHPELDYCVTRFRFFREANCEIPNCFKPGLFDGDHVGRIMSTLMARRSSFERFAYFDEDLRSAADVDWFARMKDAGARISVVEATLMHKRIHDRNFSNLALVNNAEMLLALKRSIDRQRKTPTREKA